LNKSVVGCSWQALEELRLFGNQLSAAPDFGSGMPALSLLELHNNNIEELPEVPPPHTFCISFAFAPPPCVHARTRNPLWP